MSLHEFLAAAGMPAAWPHPLTGRIAVIRGSAGARHAAAMAVLAGLDAATPGQTVIQPAPASHWPFLPGHGTPDEHGAADAVVWVPDLHEAFVNRQTNATRLVTTQPAYLLEIWRTWIDRHPARRLVATAAVLPLTEHAEEALAGRGPWRDVEWIDVDGDGAQEPAPGVAGMPAAFRATDPAERLALAGRAYDQGRAPELALAMASVCMEVNDLDNAGALLSRVVTDRPSWAAGHFELGKYWLRRDDMDAAASAFGEAARLLPGFAPAAANWGATLGELDRTEEALAAFRQALAADPGNSQVHNNLGVVLRETGRLAESEEAFRTVVQQMPDMAFGHYNLGHTLFLQGRYQASLASYLRGQQLDAGRSPLQASRVALARLASGDAHGALRDLRACTANLPTDYRRQVLADTQSVAWAVLSAVPDLKDWRVVGDWLAAELRRG